MANLDGLVVSLRSSRAHWRRCLGPQRCTAREGASGSAEIRGDRWVPSDCDVRTLLLRSLHFDLLKEEPEHPRVVHPGEKHAGESRDVLRGEECVEDRLGEVVEVEGRSSQILWSHSEDHLDGELGSQGRRSEWGLRIGGRHGVAYGLPPADGLAARWVSTHLNPPRVRVIIATLVNRHPSLPGESASKVAMIGAWSLYSAHSSWSRVPYTYGSSWAELCSPQPLKQHHQARAEAPRRSPLA